MKYGYAFQVRVVIMGGSFYKEIKPSKYLLFFSVATDMARV